MKLKHKQTHKREDWIDRKWRPFAAWVYLIICVTDFIVFPVAYSWFLNRYGGNISTMWEPLTLKGGGLFHISFGAILGVSAWSRGKEKITQFQSAGSVSNTEMAGITLEKESEPTEPTNEEKPYRYRG